MNKELKEISILIYEKNESINKGIEIIKRNQTKILELKSTITEMKHSLQEFNRKFKQRGELISKQENRAIEIECRRDVIEMTS